MAENTLVLRIPPDEEVPGALKSEVESVLTELVPVVTARVKEKRRTDLELLIEALMRGVELRSLDVRHARMQARALQAVLENSEWLTAEEIGEYGKFSPSNLAAPANRWKQEGKIFALPHQGQDRFPRYGLDEVFRPVPELKAVLNVLGPISPWRISVWFESTNAWLNNQRPRERLDTDPMSVLRAAERYRNIGHG